MLKSISKSAMSRRNTKFFARLLTSASTNPATQKGDAKPLKFDLSYIVRIFNENYKHLKPLVTIESPVMKYDEPVFVFPGVEGRAENIQPLIGNLQRTAHCLQYPYEKSTASIPQLASSLLSVLTPYIDEAKKVNMVAHSFGGLVAMEVLKLLEKEGIFARLCLMDSTPYALRVMNRISYGDFTREATFASGILTNLATGLGIATDGEFARQLDLGKTWTEKMHNVLPIMTQNTTFNEHNLRIILNGIYNVLHSMHHFDDYSGGKLKSEATIIRSTIKVLPFPQDFKAEQFFENVTEFYTDGHHLNMVKYPKTASIINTAFQAV